MGYDLSQPNDAPGVCAKCKGSGVYRWGTFTNGRAAHEGPCFSCQGSGRQGTRQIRRNHAYNRHKIAEIAHGDFIRDPGEDAADRWSEEHGSDR